MAWEGITTWAGVEDSDRPVHPLVFSFSALFHALTLSAHLHIRPLHVFCCRTFFFPACCVTILVDGTVELVRTFVRTSVPASKRIGLNIQMYSKREVGTLWWCNSHPVLARRT